MGAVDKAVSWAANIANDDSYKYVWGGWGKNDGGYDCSHFVITAYKTAGVNVGSATYTGDMYRVFTNNGFDDVTSSVNLTNGVGLKKGDVLLNTVHHAAMVQKDGGTTVEARGKDYGIVSDVAYRNYPWNYVLRFRETSSIGVTFGKNESYMYSENTYSDETKESSVVWNNRVKENINSKLQGLPFVASNGELRVYCDDTDITAMVGNLTWKNSIYELATTMSFDMPKTDAKYISNLIITPKVGDIIRLGTDTEVFRGVILKVDDGDIDVNKYSIADMGWYLNKTTQTYQFKNITAGDAIKEICDDLSIPIAMLSELSTNINQIYFDKTISSIITDILSKCEGDFNYDFTPQGLRIYRIGDLIATPQVSVASNVAVRNATDYRGGVSHSISIEEMKNSIKITAEKDNVYKELMVLQNRELIDKYGFLQKVVKIDEEKENAETVAEAELESGSKLSETLSFEIVEKYNSYTRAGEIIELEGIKYVIESTDHSFKNGYHYTKMEIEKVG